MDDRLFSVESTEHPTGAVRGHCAGCNATVTASAEEVLGWKQSHKCPQPDAKGVYAAGEPVERPGEPQEEAVDEIAPQREQFGPFERSILAFESDWARAHPATGHANTGPKEAAIHDGFDGISATRYYQVLNRLLDMDEAERFDPATVRRLRRIREGKRAERERATDAQRRIRAEMDNRRGRDAETTDQLEQHVATSVGERCEMLAEVCRKAGLRAGPGGPNRAVPTHVVVGLGPDGIGYYRLAPAVGESVIVNYVPPEGDTRYLGQALTHARAVGRVLDHLAGVTA